jgi:hypothetical protein
MFPVTFQQRECTMMSARTFAILLTTVGGLSASSAFSLRLSHCGGAGSPPHRVYAAAPRISLSMSTPTSSALIVQNKGGGHGELGYQLARNLSSNAKISSITILQDSACNPAKEPFASYSSDLPNVRVVEADLGDESTTAEDIMSLLGGRTYDYVWDNASKGDTGVGKGMVDCAKAWNSRMLVYVSSAGIYKPDGTVGF